MVLFDRADPERPNRLDWQILLNGAISLYVSQIALEEACQWFSEHGYQIYRFDCVQWKTEEAFYAEMRETLNLPDYCGGNLDSLGDCLTDIAIPYDGGAILVFDRFGVFAKRHPRLAQGLLNIIAINSRQLLLTGYRLIALVQVDDQNMTFEPVGACSVLLNPVEYRNKIRGTRFEHLGRRQKKHQNAR
jgi:RNAse (barnase) inhibitor barstar